MLPDCPAVFVDTGLEYPEIRNFVKQTPNVTWIRPEMNFRKVIEKYGYPLISKEVAQKIYEARQKPDGVVAQRFVPGCEYETKFGGKYSMVKWRWLLESDIPISHMCCNVMKKKPSKKYEKETGRAPVLGTMASESMLRRVNWFRHGCNAFDSKRPKSAPLSFWTEQDILKYITKNNIPYATVYGDIVSQDGKLQATGRKRTGCIWCGFGCHREDNPNRFQQLRQTHPKLWEYCMKPWSEGGLGMRKVLEFIGVEVD